jgi:hypothetical protein
MKAFYESKTFWFNALTVVLAIAAYFGFGEFQADPKALELGSVIVAVINIVLRFATSKAIA